MQLKDAQLFRQQAFIDGQWLDADSGQTIAVNNPATGEILGSVPKMGRAEPRRATEAAERALPAWRALTAKERAGKLRKWFELIMAHQEDLAVLMTSEQGKPLAEARGEVAYGASFIEWFAEEGKRVYGDVVPAHGHQAVGGGNVQRRQRALHHGRQEEGAGQHARTGDCEWPAVGVDRQQEHAELDRDGLAAIGPGDGHRSERHDRQQFPRHCLCPSGHHRHRARHAVRGGE